MSDPPTAAPTAANPRQAYADWVDKCPLRVWRLTQDPVVPLAEAAGMLGVGMSMIQMYERGIHKPRPDREAKFAAVLGGDWEQRWDTWLAARP